MHQVLGALSIPTAIDVEGMANSTLTTLTTPITTVVTVSVVLFAVGLVIRVIKRRAARIGS